MYIIHLWVRICQGGVEICGISNQNEKTGYIIIQLAAQSVLIIKFEKIILTQKIPVSAADIVLHTMLHLMLHYAIKRCISAYTGYNFLLCMLF